MLRTLTALNNLLGTLLALVVLCLLIGAGWFAWNSYFAEKWSAEKARRELAAREIELTELSQQLETEREEAARIQSQLADSRQRNTELETEIKQQEVEIAVLHDDLAKKRQEIQRLNVAMKLLKVDHRVAEIVVLDRSGSAREDDLKTTFHFVEIDRNGQPLEKPRVFTVEGDVIYLDAWVIKFTDELVESGDPLRSTSICLFKRIFGESQPPSEGFALDPVGSRPTAYRNGAKMSSLEEQLWTRFWDYANDPKMASESGVRAAHGEAPSVKLMPGKRYRVLLRASGGLSITVENAPVDESATF